LAAKRINQAKRVGPKKEKHLMKHANEKDQETIKPTTKPKGAKEEEAELQEKDLDKVTGGAVDAFLKIE